MKIKAPRCVDKMGGRGGGGAAAPLTPVVFFAWGEAVGAVEPDPVPG